ncbi:MAG: hypothetical protein IPL62_12765 [Caulobacteraceae bacterium]|nr:hypothetical protein [Caulobacteraceae bacterium]
MIQSSLTRTLGANFEQLMLTGFASIAGCGNALNNLLIGNGVDNLLWFDGNDNQRRVWRRSDVRRQRR